MNLGSDMMRHQADDPLAIGSAHPASRIGDPGSEPIDPQPTIGIEHDLDDRGIFKPSGNLRPERSMRAPREDACDWMGITLINCLVSARHPIIGCAREADQRDIKAGECNSELRAGCRGGRAEMLA